LFFFHFSGIERVLERRERDNSRVWAWRERERERDGERETEGEFLWWGFLISRERIRW